MMPSLPSRKLVLAWPQYIVRLAHYYLAQSALLRFLVTVLCIMVLSAATIIVSDMPWNLLSLGLSLCVWLILTVLAFVTRRDIKRIQAKRRAQEWQQELRVQNQWIKERDLDRIRFAFDGPPYTSVAENDIRLVTHEATAHLWLQLGRPLGLLVLALCAWIVASQSPFSTLILPAMSVFTLMAMLFALVWCWVIWLGWSCYYVVFTTQNVRRIRIPPDWLPWLESENEPLSLTVIDKVWYGDDPVGNLLGYGTLKIGTLMQSNEDENFNNMRYLPKHRELAQILRGLVPNLKPS